MSIRIEKQDAEILLKLGVKAEEIEIIKGADCVVEYEVVDDVLVRVTLDCAKEELGLEDFWSGIDRAVFHWTAYRESKKGGVFLFNTHDWHEGKESECEDEAYTELPTLEGLSDEEKAEILGEYFIKECCGERVQQLINIEEDDVESAINYCDKKGDFSYVEDAVFEVVYEKVGNATMYNGQCYEYLKDVGMGWACERAANMGLELKDADEFKIANAAMEQDVMEEIDWGKFEELHNKLYPSNDED